MELDERWGVSMVEAGKMTKPFEEERRFGDELEECEEDEDLLIESEGIASRVCDADNAEEVNKL